MNYPFGRHDPNWIRESQTVHTTNDEDRGFYRKYEVRRTDGSSEPGGKHENCEYFVLDLTHDPHALPALRRYAESCRDRFPILAKELNSMCAFYEAKIAARRQEQEGRG